MGRMSRAKGAKGENEVRDIVRAAGWPDATRNWRSGAYGFGDIARGPALTVIESKLTDNFRLHACWEQVSGDARRAGPGYLPLLAHRWSRGPWLGITELDELLALIHLRETA